MKTRSVASALALLIGHTASLQGQITANKEPFEISKVSLPGEDVSLRGLHLVDASCFWASGNGGTVLRSTDAGASWISVSPPDAGSLDFRDIHAWSENEAIVISAGSPARIYRTEDGGTQWTLVHEDLRPPVFFDALSFFNRDEGLAFSDPLDDGRLLLIETSDGGRSWRELPLESRPEMREEEAGFAASGTSMCVIDDLVLIGCGGWEGSGAGSTSRILRSEDRGHSWSEVDSRMVTGVSAGIFSIAFANRDHGVAVGGDFSQPASNAGNASWTSDGGLHWHEPVQPPRGYRSCAAAIRGAAEPSFVCCGPTGCDLSVDGGRTWVALSDEWFHAIAVTPDGTTAIATSGGGKIGIWRIR